MALSLIPLLLSNFVGYTVSRRIQTGQIESFLLAFAETQSAHVVDGLRRHQLALDAIVRSHTELWPSIARADIEFSQGAAGRASGELSRQLVHEVVEFPAFEDLVLLSARGVAVAATSGRWLGNDWSGERFFIEGRNLEPYFEPLSDASGEVHSVYVATHPLMDGNGHLLGMLAATTPFDSLAGVFKILPHLAQYVETYILDTAGRPILVSHPHEPIDPTRPLASPLSRADPGSVGRYVNYAGTEVVGASARIAGTDWVCVTEAPIQVVYGPLRQLGILSAMAEGVFALVLVATVWLVARSIVRPLRRLMAGAEVIRAGGLGVEVPVEREDELGQLVHTFNGMSQELARARREAYDLHQEEMRRAAQLASVGELASGMAHEIKNPVAGIASGLELLRKHLRDDLRSQETLSLVRTQLARIESAITDLLSYAKPREPQALPVDALQLVQRTMTLVKPQAEARGIRIATQPGSAPPMMADPEQITQALVNLALNAIQAMGPGGELAFSVTGADDEVRVTVSDTGSGIPPERLDDIFRPFVTTKHRGSGLGLAITRGIVERNGGRIEVSSEVGRGSQFTLVLPAAGGVQE